MVLGGVLRVGFKTVMDYFVCLFLLMRRVGILCYTACLLLLSESHLRLTGGLCWMLGFFLVYDNVWIYETPPFCFVLLLDWGIGSLYLSEFFFVDVCGYV